MFVYRFILLSFLLPIHSFFINPNINPVTLLIAHKKGLKDRCVHCSKISCNCNCYRGNKHFQKIQNITELQIHLNKTLALPVRWNDGEVPW